MRLQAHSIEWQPPKMSPNEHLTSFPPSQMNVRCANTQPFCVVEPFQAILGNCQAILGNLLGPSSGDSGNSRQF